MKNPFLHCFYRNLIVKITLRLSIKDIIFGGVGETLNNPPRL